MRAWTNSVRELALRITEFGGVVSDDEQIVVLTNNVPDSYQPLIVSLELVEESNITIDYVISRLINEENRQGSGENGANGENAALSARSTRTRTPES